MPKSRVPVDQIRSNVRHDSLVNGVRRFFSKRMQGVPVDIIDRYNDAFIRLKDAGDPSKAIDLLERELVLKRPESVNLDEETRRAKELLNRLRSLPEKPK